MLTEVEKYIGEINGDYTHGGRIDIAITDGVGNQIYIENKIYAKDQKNQLLRYHNSNMDAELFYLTLEGDTPSKESTGGTLTNDNYKCISYKVDILHWLQKCRKESVNIPVVRETITQYISLINILTNQSEQNAMSKEIRQFIIQNIELIESVELCHKELESIINETKALFFKKLNYSFSQAKEIPFDDYAISLKWGEDGDGVHFGYQAINDDKVFQDIDKVGQHSVLLKKIDKRFHSDKNWLGWLNPSPFKSGQRFTHLPINKILNYYSDTGALDSLVEEVVKQENNIRTKFIQSI